jgi:uncharacterized protein (TIGR02453 family)
MSEFKGFKPTLFKFIKDLKSNNNRDWFTENKPRYQNDVVEPLLLFMDELKPKLHKVTPHILVKPKAHNGSMFRIYRDTRFSKNKDPYKEHAACQFRHELGRDAHAPGFYFHLEPGKVFFGGGVWMADSESLHKIRQYIVDNPRAWSNVKKNAKVKKYFPDGIAGNGLSRPPRGFDKEHIHIEDLKRKSFFLMRTVPMKIAKSAEIVDEVAATYKASMPLMRFLGKALEVKI